MTLTDAQRARVAHIRACPYIPYEPTLRQWRLLLTDAQEIFYGGAAGGAKSVGLLMAALADVDNPGHNALLLRRTFQDLALPGALMDMARDWLAGTDATPIDGGRSWEFPSGATITFGYLASAHDRYRYQGTAFSCLCWDELTQFPERDYRYLFSRLRRPTRDAQVPLRVYAAGNPGGVYHDWVKARFVTNPEAGRVFISSKIADNPHLDAEAYRAALATLDPVTRRQLEHGDWEVSVSGGFIPVENLVRYPSEASGRPSESLRVRSWDLAATSDGDASAGVLIALDTTDRTYTVEDVVHVRQGPSELERTIRATAERDGTGTTIVIEQEGGSAGIMAMRDLRTRILAGYPVHPIRPTGPKIERARLVASLAAAGDIAVAEAGWTEGYIDELRGFPEAAHDDQVDATSQALHWLSRNLGNRPPAVPRGGRDREGNGVSPQSKMRIVR